MREYEVRYVHRERGIDSEKRKTITISAASKDDARKQVEKIGEGAYYFRIDSVREKDNRPIVSSTYESKPVSKSNGLSKQDARLLGIIFMSILAGICLVFAITEVSNGFYVLSGILFAFAALFIGLAVYIFIKKK